MGVAEQYTAIKGILDGIGTGSITAYASGTNTTVTSAAHGLSNGNIVTITASTAGQYDAASLTISSVTTNTFDIITAFGTDPGDGTWTRTSAAFTINNTFTGRQFWADDNVMTTNAGATINSKGVIEWWELFCTGQNNEQGETEVNYHMSTMRIDGYFSFSTLADFDGSSNSTEVVFNQKVETIVKALANASNFTLSSNIDIRDRTDPATVCVEQVCKFVLHTCQIIIPNMQTEF